MNRPEAIEALLAVVGRATARWIEDETPNPHDLHDLTMALAAVRASSFLPPRTGEPRAIDQRGVLTSNTFEGQRTGTMQIGWAEKDGKPAMTYKWIPDIPAPPLRSLTRADTQEALHHLDRMAAVQTSAFSEAVDVLRRRIDELEKTPEVTRDTPVAQADLVLTSVEARAMRSLLGAWYGLWLGKDKHDDLAQRTQRRIIVASHFPDKATMGEVNRCLEKFGFRDWPAADATSAQTPAHERVPRPSVHLSRQVNSSPSPADCCAIVGGSTHAVIGTTHGADGRASALAEEPEATFHPLPAFLCPICSPDNDPTPTDRFLRPVRTAQRVPGAALLPVDDNEAREMHAWKLPGGELYRLTAVGRATGQTWEIVVRADGHSLTRDPRQVLLGAGDLPSKQDALAHASSLGVPYVQYLAELTGRR